MLQLCVSESSLLISLSRDPSNLDLPSSSKWQAVLIEYPANRPAVAEGYVGASDCFTTNGPAKLPQQYAELVKMIASASIR